MNQYKTIEWKQYRCEVIESDGNACVRCGANSNSGAVLQVHHRFYIPGRKPWEYPPKLCETLCKGCHAQEHGIIRPEIGWDLIASEDLGSLDGECDRCGKELRYVYLVGHPKWETMQVGTNCCDGLTLTNNASSHTKSLILKEQRYENLVNSPRWKSLERGREIRKANADLRIVIDGSKYLICVNGRLGKQHHDTEQAAMFALFELIESGELQKYLTRKLKAA
jgi:hypothetical protein